MEQAELLKQALIWADQIKREESYLDSVEQGLYEARGKIAAYWNIGDGANAAEVIASIDSILAKAAQSLELFRDGDES